MVQGLTERTGGPDKGAAAAMPTGGEIGSADLCSCRFVGENRHRRLFDEHELDAGLARPFRKIHRGDTLTKQRWFRHGGQCWNRQSRQSRQQVLGMSLDGPRLDEKDCRFRHWGSGSPWDSVTDWTVQGSTRKTAGLDTGAVAARGTVSADSAAVSASAAFV
jgi:hypothetical protein